MNTTDMHVQAQMNHNSHNIVHVNYATFVALPDEGITGLPKNPAIRRSAVEARSH